MMDDSNLQVLKLSVSDVVIAYRIPRSKVLKHIHNGDLKLNSKKLIDYFQLVEFFGEPVNLKKPEFDLLIEYRKLKDRILILENMIISHDHRSV